VCLDLGEPSGVEDPQEILGFPETSAGGRGLRRLWIAMRRYRVEEQLPGDVFGRRRPARERHPSIPPQDSPCLGQCPDRIGHVVDPEIRDDSVERGIGKRQRFRIPFFKADLGIRCAGEPDHCRGEIKSRGDGAVQPCCARDETGSAGEVQHLHSCADPRSVEQIIDDAAGRAREGCAITRRRLLPASMLESANRLRVKAHDGPSVLLPGTALRMGPLLTALRQHGLRVLRGRAGVVRRERGRP
jgi:hypothetical protein